MFGLGSGTGGAIKGAMMGQQQMQKPQKPPPQRPGFSDAGTFGARPGMSQAMPSRQAQPSQASRVQSLFGQERQQNPMPMQRQASPAMMGRMMGGSLLSDERSKERIRELEDLRDRYEALLDTPSANADVERRLFNGASSNTYEYEDPGAPGASPGRHAGPMASELRSIPGVVERGPDGMDRVNPGRLALANASAMGETSREVDALKARLAALEDDPDAVLREASGGR